MVKLGKLTDYGLVLMTCIAKGQGVTLRTATDLAAESHLPLPTVSKLLKELLQSGLLVSQRGVKGGYTLARPSRDIALTEIIAALEGPVALTECSTHASGASGTCDLEPSCPIMRNQQIINQVVRGVLERITLSDLLQPMQLTSITDARGNVLPPSVVSGRIQ
jgi:FeS assembly SUF system regulator